MKKRNIAGKFLAVIALLVALVTVLSSCTYIRILQLLSQRLGNTTTHAETDFSSLEYTRPDTEVFAEQAEKVETLLGQRGKDYEVVEGFLDLVDGLEAARSAAVLMQIIHDRDVTNEENAAELEWIDNTLAEMESTYVRVLGAAIDSDYCDLLIGDLSDDEREKIERQVSAMDDEYVQIQAEITALCNRYDLAAASAETLEEFVGAAGEIYLELIGLYKREAVKFGEDSVADYCYTYLYNRSYSAEEGLAFDHAIKANVADWKATVRGAITQEELDLVRELRGTDMGELDVMMPFCVAYFEEMEDALSMKTVYDYMERNHLCDAKVKDPLRTAGCYTTFLPSPGLPFMLLSLNGNARDTDSFVHEFGHFTSFYCSGDAFELDLCEVQSQANEYLFLPYYEQAFGDIYADAYEKYRWYEAMSVIAEGCLLDEFQQVVFASEETWTVDELNETFYSLATGYGLKDGNYNYPLDKLWMFIPHTFHVPFYYISYATSIVPALEIAALAATDRDAAIQAYTEIVCPRDATLSFGEIVTGAGLVSPFTEAGVDAISDGVRLIAGGTLPQEEAVPSSGEGTAESQNAGKGEWSNPVE